MLNTVTCVFCPCLPISQWHIFASLLLPSFDSTLPLVRYRQQKQTSNCDTFLDPAGKQNLTFHSNCLLWRQFEWNVKLCFHGNITKTLEGVVCLSWMSAWLRLKYLVPRVIRLNLQAAVEGEGSQYYCVERPWCSGSHLPYKPGVAGSIPLYPSCLDETLNWVSISIWPLL